MADRGRIRRALLDLCSERGFKRLGLQEVLDRADVGEAAFRSEFESLEDCFCDVLEAETAELLTRCWQSFVGPDGWRSQLRAVARTMLDFLQEDHARARTMTIEVDSAGERARLIRDQGMQALFAFIDLGRAELDDPTSISPATAEAIGGAIFSQIRIEIEHGDSASLSALLPQLMYAVVLPYLGPEAALEELEIPPLTLPELLRRPEGAR